MRQLVKDWVNRNRERVNFLKKRWEEKNKSYHNKYNKKYNKSKQLKARNKSDRFIKIPERKLCEECKVNLVVEKHHEDYNKPLEVVFLCRKCHTQKREWIKPFKKNIIELEGGNI